MCLVNAVENLTARTGAGRKLGYEGKEQVATGLEELAKDELRQEAVKEQVTR